MVYCPALESTGTHTLALQTFDCIAAVFVFRASGLDCSGDEQANSITTDINNRQLDICGMTPNGSNLYPETWNNIWGWRGISLVYESEYNGSVGCHSHGLHSHSCDCRSKLWPVLFSVWLLTTLIFGDLTTDCIEFQPLTTCIFTEVYGRMSSNSTPPLVCGQEGGGSCYYWVCGSNTPTVHVVPH